MARRGNLRVLRAELSPEKGYEVKFTCFGPRLPHWLSRLKLPLDNILAFVRLTQG